MFTRFAAKATALSFALAAAFVAQAPAQAQDTRSHAVRYADLDLTSAAGAATLNHRIARAATIVCGPAERETLAEGNARKVCRAAAIASAEPQMQILLAQAASGTQLADARQAMIAVRAGR